ncbi:MAG: two pore domain potassium channel family protein, partial [Nocardioides sp.]
MSVLGALRRHPSGVLLVGQLLAVLAYPFIGTSIPGRAALGAMSTVLVLVALYAVRRTPALAWVALIFGAPAVVFNALEVVWPNSDAILLSSALLHAPFYFYGSYGMIRYLFHDDQVTRDELYATGAAFTVVAWGFAYLHLAVQVIWPGSYGAGAERSFFELLYL